MIRKIITIDKEKCNGCGICVEACHEGAIGMVDGKAQLMRDDYCDGLGDCLPTCPTGAITFEEREAAPFDKEAVMENMRIKEEQKRTSAKPSTCPGSSSRSFQRDNGGNCKDNHAHSNHTCQGKGARTLSVNPQEISSELRQWPVQIKLAPVNAEFFNGAHLLIAADCTAFAYGNFHQDFMKNKITLIGCPKLDNTDYSEKLTAIIRDNDIESVTIVKMEVPCCNGMLNMAKKALMDSGKFIPWQVVTISVDGNIIQ
ncbi:MAG: 4Fe-4S binding protein [Tissierellia bacterium]|nr:4Fe-4S binding protein [Tissierellia bacterium]